MPEDQNEEKTPLEHAIENPDEYELVIGEPFALSLDCELLHEQKAIGVPGCYASLACKCGQQFRIDLLTDTIKVCPGCGTKFTHILTVNPVDDNSMPIHILKEIWAASGLEVPESDDGDESDNEETEAEQIPEAGEAQAD